MTILRPFVEEKLTQNLNKNEMKKNEIRFANILYILSSCSDVKHNKPTINKQ